MSIKPKLMWRGRTKAGVADKVRTRADEAAQLAKIPGQHRLTDPRTNPAVRAYADELRDDQHRRMLGAEHGRLLRRHRVADRRAESAERALQALEEARETLSPAKSVLALHAGRNRFLRLSLGASIVLAFGSALGLEHLAETHNVPTGSGYISEVGLTGLATVVILARSELSRNGGKLKGWQDAVLWLLMVAPLTVSMAGNIYGKNIIGAVCAAMAAAFSLFSYVVADAFASSAGDQAARVTDDKENELRDIASGDDLFAERAPQTFFEAQATGLPFTPVTFGAKTVVSASVVEPPSASQASDPDAGHATPKSLTQGSDATMTQVTGQVTPQVTSEVTGQVTPEVTPKPPAQVTPEVTPEPLAQATPRVTADAPAKSPAKPQQRGGTAARRTDEELKRELAVIADQHFRDHPGEEIKVKPVAAQLQIGRDRCRRLLDELNVRPMRKAANQ